MTRMKHTTPLFGLFLPIPFPPFCLLFRPCRALQCGGFPFFFAAAKEKNCVSSRVVVSEWLPPLLFQSRSRQKSSTRRCDDTFRRAHSHEPIRGAASSILNKTSCASCGFTINFSRVRKAASCLCVCFIDSWPCKSRVCWPAGSAALHVGPQQTPYNHTKKGLQAACRRLASLSHRPGGFAVWAPMPNASERIHVHVFSVRFTAHCHSFVHTLSHRWERMTASENDVGTTQLVTSDIARWGKQGREVGSSKTPTTRCTRPRNTDHTPVRRVSASAVDVAGLSRPRQIVCVHDTRSRPCTSYFCALFSPLVCCSQESAPVFPDRRIKVVPTNERPGACRIVQLDRSPSRHVIPSHAGFAWA